MITLEEKEVQQTENKDDKIKLLKESLSKGELPEDLKDFITHLQTEKQDKSADELLDDSEETSEEEEMIDNEDDDDMTDISDSSVTIEEDPNVSVDDLNDMF